MGLLDGTSAPTQAPFSILGLLLGGRQYGANYFAQRDQLIQQANERARVGAAAESLLQTPQYKAAVTDPTEQAQFNLWAKMQPDFSSMGNNLLSQQVGSIYQSQSQAQQAANAEKQLRLSDQLERERMGISVDDQLKMDAIKRQRDQADTAAGYKQLLSMPGAMGVTALLDKFGIRPGQDRIFTGIDQQTGVPTQSLLRGSDTWNKAADEIAPLKDSAQATQVLSDMASGNVPFNQGVWNATRNSLVENIMKGKGTYDDGLAKLMDQMIPDEGRFTPDWLKTKATQLDMAVKLYNGRAQQAAQKWGVNLDDMPSSAMRLSGITPNIPPPTTDPNAAQKQLQKQADQVPATIHSGRYNPKVGGIQLNTDPGYKLNTRSRTGQPMQ